MREGFSRAWRWFSRWAADPTEVLLRCCGVRELDTAWSLPEGFICFMRLSTRMRASRWAPTSCSDRAIMECKGAPSCDAAKDSCWEVFFLREWDCHSCLPRIIFGRRTRRISE